jgi:hypothetical protein
MLQSLYAALYSTLVRLHPRAFRQRFGEEMLSIFDATPDSNRSALAGDAMFSLLRQWLLRPEFHEAESSARKSVFDAPMFLVLDDEPRLSTDRWIGGAALSLISFVAASILIGHGGHPSARSIGSRLSSETGVRVQASSGALDTEVTVNQDVVPRGYRFGARYFHLIAVLDALDVNHDLILSADEIANAPQILETLDRNHDGTLDPTECLAVFSRESQLSKLTRSLEALMRSEPVLAALDADHDGIISASEVRNSPAALLQLDTNGDGRLAVEELLPESEYHPIRVLSAPASRTKGGS